MRPYQAQKSTDFSLERHVLMTWSRKGPVPTLHPQILQVLKALEDAKFRPLELLTPAEERVQYEAIATSRKPVPLPVARVEERTIHGPAGEIRLRLYWPEKSGPVPAIAFFHGDGFVIGSLDTHDATARNLCAGAEALVAAVDYRMGPEHRFPAAVEDSWAALKCCMAMQRVSAQILCALACTATAPAAISLRCSR